MGAMMVVIDLEICELSLQVDRIPEEDMVKVFTANGTDESFNERMRAGRIRYGPSSWASVVKRWANNASRSFVGEQSREGCLREQDCLSLCV